MQPSFFAPENRLAELERLGDPLVRLDRIVDWNVFKPVLKKIHQKPRKSHAGRKPWDPVRMFKMLVLQTLYNLKNGKCSRTRSARRLSMPAEPRSTARATTATRTTSTSTRKTS